jgi:WD40 repeat protein
LRGATGDTHFVAFSPQGDRLFAGGNDGAVLGWRSERGAIDVRSQAIVTRHVGAVTALAVSPDGELVASAGRDSTVVRVVLATGARESFATAAAATTLVFDDGGAVHAVTRNGTATAWSTKRPAVAPATAVDHGVHAAASIAPYQLALALDDGAILIEPLAPRTLDALHATLAEATGNTVAR